MCSYKSSWFTRTSRNTHILLLEQSVMVCASTHAYALFIDMGGHNYSFSWGRRFRDVGSCLKAIRVDALLRPDLESSQSHLDKVKPTLQVIIRKINSLQLVPASRQILAGGGLLREGLASSPSSLSYIACRQ